MRAFRGMLGFACIGMGSGVVALCGLARVTPSSAGGAVCFDSRGVTYGHLGHSAVHGVHFVHGCPRAVCVHVARGTAGGVVEVHTVRDERIG
jgi:hypothetical protein